MNTTDDIQIGFYVSADGTSFEIFGIAIPGHENVDIQLFKEFSTELVRVFEGTYQGDATGTFNMVARDNEWLVSAKNNEPQSPSLYFYGSLSSGSMTCLQCGDVVITGKISGDNISGDWDNGIDESGTWKGKRTL